MMKLSFQAAESKLSELIDAALAGEEVVIAKEGRPAVKIVPVERKSFAIGILKDHVTTSPDFFEPMSDEELALWEGRS